MRCQSSIVRRSPSVLRVEGDQQVGFHLVCRDRRRRRKGKGESAILESVSFHLRTTVLTDSCLAK